MMSNNTSKSPFTFVAGANSRDKVLEIVNNALVANEVRGSAEMLEETGVNLDVLAQRLEQGLDINSVTTLVSLGFPAEKVNEALTGDTSTDDIDTGLFWLADDPAAATIAVR